MFTLTAQPISQSERITVLDSLRGIAILGILLDEYTPVFITRADSFRSDVAGETGLNYYIWYAV